MERLTLLTLRLDGRIRTFSFDPSVQSVVWMGPQASGEGEALLCAQAAGMGLLIKGAVGVHMVVPGREAAVAGPVSVPWNTVWMLGVSIDGTPRGSLYVRPYTAGVGRFDCWELLSSATLDIGRGDACALRYEHPFVSAEHARIVFRDCSLFVEDLRSTHGTAVNGTLIRGLQPLLLSVGDLVQIADLTVLIGAGMLFVNRPQGLRCNMASVARLLAPTPHVGLAVPAAPQEPARASFYAAPRLTQSLHPLKLQVEQPPARRQEERQPVLMQIGPSFLMGMASVFMGANAVAGVLGGASVLAAMPSVCMAVALLGGTLVWPVVGRRYERRVRQVHESRRTKLYAAYLDRIENTLASAAQAQAKVLSACRTPVGELLVSAREHSPQLMSHALSHDDFLELRVGIGDEPMRADVVWPKRGIALSPDVLWDRVGELCGRPLLLEGVPVACSLREHSVVGIVGRRRRAWEFVRGLLVQVCARYSYLEVKLVLVADERERAEWEFLTSLRHLYDDTGTERRIATTAAGLERIERTLDKVVERRLDGGGPKAGRYRQHYVVVCANRGLTRHMRLVERLAACGEPMGFSLLCMGQVLAELPRECEYLIDLGADQAVRCGLTLLGQPASAVGPCHPREDTRAQNDACMFSRGDARGTCVAFEADILVSREEAHGFALAMAGIVLEDAGQDLDAPESVGFLELYGVGNVGHLNIVQRWSQADASHSLRARVGMDGHGQGCYLDLHESAHGPHGLVAGTTGSGKSEFLVTCILSLAVSYAPDDVVFLLIDYKGGGLAGAFTQEGLRLPHIVGTITNLDGSEIRRALVSVRSELKRRQRLLAYARSTTDETTMDVYRYRELYREGVLGEPLPHLVIVADEFAELKQQEPDFMEELMSAARIGRSLGVHLVLATQKPSGVVSDQIWANARFKVSLKVADVADSRELLRRDDAAYLTRPGAYYLLVGYDEAFLGAQAAYAGGRYVPRDRFEPRRDRSVELLDAEGRAAARALPPHAVSAADGVSELQAVLAELVRSAEATGLSPRPLWLAPLPKMLTPADLERRFGPAPSAGVVADVGMYDDPEHQLQDRLSVDFAREGNVLLCAAQPADGDRLLRGMLSSLLGRYGADRIWVYALDCSGSLDGLARCAQVGGVATLQDAERLANALRLFERMLAKRRSTHNSQVRRPAVVVAIANVGALLELDVSIEERLVAFLRDAPACGIYTVATTGGSHALPMRLQSCFTTLFALGFAEREAYVSLLGGGASVLPARSGMRGLARIGDRLLEFSGVRAAYDKAAEQVLFCGLSQAQSPGAGAGVPGIPMLPSVVDGASMGDAPSATSLPVGFAKDAVEPRFIELAHERIVMVAGNDRPSLDAFLSCACRTMACHSRVGVVDLGDAVRLDGAVLVTAVCEQDVLGLTEGLRSADVKLDVLVVAHVAQAMESLGSTCARKLASLFAACAAGEGPGLVLATEAWRVASLYDGWYRLVSTQGAGLWVGAGFADQTMLRYARIMPEYRVARRRDDGFVVRGGNVEAVRVLGVGNGEGAGR